jgi:hypothetical protein
MAGMGCSGGWEAGTLWRTTTRMSNQSSRAPDATWAILGASGGGLALGCDLYMIGSVVNLYVLSPYDASLASGAPGSRF